ncbi:MAG: hypothetical protein F6K30_16165 [Cyanothece sp. SIO2G6]|nr:hypothetical protein [Cyanothece sp. SIO2G6]
MTRFSIQDDRVWRNHPHASDCFPSKAWAIADQEMGIAIMQAKMGAIASGMSMGQSVSS